MYSIIKKKFANFNLCIDKVNHFFMYLFNDIFYFIYLFYYLLIYPIS